MCHATFSVGPLCFCTNERQNAKPKEKCNGGSSRNGEYYFKFKFTLLCIAVQPSGGTFVLTQIMIFLFFFVVFFFCIFQPCFFFVVLVLLCIFSSVNFSIILISLGVVDFLFFCVSLSAVCESETKINS